MLPEGPEYTGIKYRTNITSVLYSYVWKSDDLVGEAGGASQGVEPSTSFEHAGVLPLLLSPNILLAD